MTEEEEGELLATEFGPADADGIYGAPPVEDDTADEDAAAEDDTAGEDVAPPVGPQKGGA